MRTTSATFSEDALQFSWQAQHFGRVHRHFAWQAQHFRRVVLRVFYKSHWQGCVKWRQGADSMADVILFEVANLKARTKTRRKTSILKLQSVKIGGSLARKARFDAPTSLVSSLWFSCGVAVSMGEAAKSLLFEGFQAGCHVVLRGRGGTLHSTLRTLHSTLHTLHSTTLHTLHTPPLHTLN